MNDEIVGEGVGFRRIRRNCCRISDVECMNEAMRKEEQDRVKHKVEDDSSPKNRLTELAEWLSD